MSLESSRKSITSTPHAQRISSSFRSNEEFPITVEQLGKAMETELHAAEFTVPSLAEVAFPADVLTGIDGDLSAHIQWTSQSAHSEIGMAEWLNDLGTQLGAYFKCEVIRQWSSGCSSIEPSGSAIRRKPDLVLLDSPIAGQKVKWQTIRALGETTNEVVAPRRMTDTVKQKSFLIFVKQLDRCFVPSLSFTQSNFQFTICDRSGVVVTGFLPLERNKTCFLRILAGLMLTSDENIGYDTTMHHTSNGEIDSIRVQGVEYSVVKNLFMAKTIRGRATQCWQVSRGDEQFIIKDSWIATTRMSNEIDTLKHIQGIQCVPRFIAGEDVTLSNKKPNSTESRRQGITSFEENRVRRRLVTQPVAEPIESFSSKKELIGALLDIVKGDLFLFALYLKACSAYFLFLAHQDSYERSTLHRDVSLNNCMLWSDPQHPSMRRGLLNDFDYALRVDLQPNVPSPVHRTVSHLQKGLYVILKLLDCRVQSLICPCKCCEQIARSICLLTIWSLYSTSYWTSARYTRVQDYVEMTKISRSINHFLCNNGLSFLHQIWHILRIPKAELYPLSQSSNGDFCINLPLTLMI